MMTQRKRVPALAALITMVVIVAVGGLFAQPLARFALVGIARAAGMQLSYERLDIHSDRTFARNLRVRSNAGEPIAEIGSFAVSYSLRDFLPGGTRMFGLRSFDVEHAHVTIIRHRDGTYNIPFPHVQGGTAPSRVPFIFTGRVHDASLDVYDHTQHNPANAHLLVRSMNGDFNVATNARTQYDAKLIYVEDGVSYPVRGEGDIDVPGGIGLQEWHVVMIPIARIADVAIDSPSFHIVGGALRNLDARIIGLPGTDGALDQRVNITARLDRARIALGGLSKPLRNVHGRVAVFGDGLLLENVDATVANVPIHLGGGVYGLRAPSMRLTANGAGDLRDLRTAIVQSAKLPVAGAARLDVAVEGPLTKPLTFVSLAAPRARYGALPLSVPNATVAFDGDAATLVDVRGAAKGVTLRGHGRYALHPGSNALEVIAGADTSADALPYANALIPHMPLHASVLASAASLKRIDTRGVLAGAHDAQRLNAVFALRSDGVGMVGPLTLDEAGRSLYALAAVDRPHDRVDAYLDASHVRVAEMSSSATLDGRLFATLHGGRANVAGTAMLSDIHTPHVDVARAAARFGTRGRALLAALDAEGIGRVGAIASALLSYNAGTLHVDDATAQLGGSFAAAHGVVAGLPGTNPAVHFNATLHSADISPLVGLVQPERARLVEGSAEAHLVLSGSQRAPRIDGDIALPEGAVNGLAFHDVSARMHSNGDAIALDDGHISVGSSDLAFAGTLAPSAQRLKVDAPRLDAEDFNDFFDAGDMLGGQGQVRAAVAMDDGRLTSTSGRVAMHNTKVRNVQLGATSATWQSRGTNIDAVATADTHAGTFAVLGDVTSAGDVNLAAHARKANLANWLPLAGIDTPVTGLADADVALAGRIPDIHTTLHGRVVRATVGRIPVSQLTVAGDMRAGRGRLNALTLDAANARIDANGTFGVHPNDPLALTAHGRTPDVAALAKTVLGRPFDAAGAFDTTVHVAGTRMHPAIDDDFVVNQARYSVLSVPHVTGHVHADEHAVALRDFVANLPKGRLLGNASVPITLLPFAIDPHNRAVSGSLTADDVEVSNIAPLLPKGTKATGRVDGRVALSGTMHAPQFNGDMRLAQASFSGPQERVPITAGSGELSVAGTTFSLKRLQADVGGGTIGADGKAVVTDMLDPRGSSVDLAMHARDARLDLPQYIKGRFNGDVTLTRSPSAIPRIGGSITVASARIPLSAVLPSSSGSGGPALPNVAFDMNMNVDRDVRVVSPNVDVGGQGSVHVGGTLASPQLSGALTSTGGTVSFFHTFRLQSARVRFDPSDGVIPRINARATTSISDPLTNVALHVTGPATALNIDFTSDPAYDRQQILGLLVGAQSFGAVQGVAATNSAPFSASSAVLGFAKGQVNDLFTRNLFEPLSVALGGDLGLQNLQITEDLQSGLGVNAVKAFGKNLTFAYAQSFNPPRRQSLTLSVLASNATRYALTVFSVEDGSLVALGQPASIDEFGRFGNPNFATIMNTIGNGVVFKAERRFP